MSIKSLNCFVKKSVAFLLLAVCLFALVGCNSQKTKLDNPAEYDSLWTLGDRRVSHSSFLFPTSIDTAKVLKFDCEHTDSLIPGARWQAVLELQYDADGFAFELDKTKALCRGSAVYGESEYFEYEAYASVWNYDGCFEYALFNSEKLTVTYVYLQHKDKKDVTLDSTLIPHGYKNQMDGDEFSIY